MRKYLLILLLLIHISVIVNIGKFISIGHISCTSQFGYCNNAIVEEIKRNEGAKYSNAKVNISRLLKSNIRLKSYSIQYKIPNYLEISIIERKPTSALLAGDNLYYLIDSDGYVMESVVQTSLPYIQDASQTPSIGSKIGDNVIFSTNILNYLLALYSVNKGSLYADRIEFIVPNGPVVIFPLNGDKEVLVGSLRLILENISQKTKDFNLEKAYNQITIDLRYKNPVLR